MTRYCRECSVKSRAIKEEESLKLWKQQHIEDDASKINHVGSALSMETEGPTRIFQRSINIHNNGRYLYYYGAGDSKAFCSVENVYDGASSHFSKKIWFIFMLMFLDPPSPLMKHTLGCKARAVLFFERK